MTTICDKENCTGCGLCQYLCPKQCISFQMDSLGVEYPIIDNTKCISCNICKNICPSLYPLIEQQIDIAAVAWSTNQEVRNQGASGGIAQEIYQWALRNHFCVYGVTFTKEKGANYIKVTNDEDIKSVRNSKYVYSNLKGCFSQVDEDWKKQKKILWIGLPCQVAAIKKLAKKRKKEDHLITIELICHGTPPNRYLEEHLDYLEKKYQKKIKNISFRNPNSQYRFCLYNQKNQKFYCKKPDENDTYFKGFMSNLILRENCYHCHYAKETRISDITIGDVDGSKFLSIPEKKQISLVLISTKKGKDLFEFLIKEKKVKAIEQDIKKVTEKNKALHHPSKKHPKRYLFEQKYMKKKDFEQAAKFALKKDFIQYNLFYIPNQLKYLFFRIMPKSIKETLKKIKK